MSSKGEEATPTKEDLFAKMPTKLAFPGSSLLGPFGHNGKAYQFISVALLFERGPIKLH